MGMADATSLMMMAFLVCLYRIDGIGQLLAHDACDKRRPIHVSRSISPHPEHASRLQTPYSGQSGNDADIWSRDDDIGRPHFAPGVSVKTAHPDLMFDKQNKYFPYGFSFRPTTRVIGQLGGAQKHNL